MLHVTGAQLKVPQHSAAALIETEFNLLHTLLEGEDRLQLRLEDIRIELEPIRFLASDSTFRQLLDYWKASSCAMSDKPESSVTPGHPDYRRYLSNNLLLRWSTPADRAGCAMVSSMAWSVPEGEEMDRFVRVPERMAMSDYYWGDPSAWAVCVELSGPRLFPRKDSASRDSPYVARLRQEASEAREPVVALIHYKIMKWAFERSTCEVDVLKSWIVACRTDLRAAVGTENIMKGLFEMVHNRGQLLSVAFFHINGIPAYYRNHGYEYALHFGRHLSTTTSELPNSPAPLIFQPPATTTNGIKSPNTLEPSSTSPDGSTPQQRYRLRQATSLDTPVLLAMHETGKSSSDVWVSLAPDLLEGAVSWAVNPREPPFAELSEDVAPPLWVLEEHEATDSKFNIVAAVELQEILDPKEPKPIARVTRLLWDERSDASIIVSELVARMVPAANDVLEAAAENIRKPVPRANIEETSNIVCNGGRVDNLPSLNTHLAYIDWYLAEGHPLRPWLISNQVAEAKLDPRFDITDDWFIFIPSLSHFITQLKPALNARLSRFEHMLGKSFGCELLITAYSRSYLGVRIRIQECAISNVEPFSAETPRPRNFGKREPNVPNICAPRGALTQLFMGYSSWQEITLRVPDAIAAPYITPVINFLFPKVTASSHVYF